MRLLLVEDETDLGEAVLERARDEGHVADRVASLEEARAALAIVDYDVVLLDLNLPDGSGRQLLREMRAFSQNIGVLVTTAEDQISQRIAGLSEGADDYVVKPFDLDELMARIDAVSRRRVSREAASLLHIGALTIDRAHGLVRREGKIVQLTAREWAVMELLSRRPGFIHSRERIEGMLYDFNGYAESNTVEVFISRLRKKLGNNVILTQRGRGYSLTDQASQ